MRLLICENCRAPAKLRDGTDYTIGRAPTVWPFRLWCAACKQITLITATKFNQMPQGPPAHEILAQQKATFESKRSGSAGSQTHESNASSTRSKPE